MPSRKRWRWALAAGAVLVGAAAAHGRFVVRGESMTPTLEPGDRLLVRRWPARARPGDLVVVVQPGPPDRLVVKRLAAARSSRLTVLGDNPAASTDSRHYGDLPRGALRGRVVYRYAPAERSGRP
ncbi:MAG TPA: nickel-type superoxide dismutase maturation protease [Egibacteraceae bacterium]|jgi:nickel-type superoxide dismutase maturation protease|nr:nickel-type superoxide dismutase maturation protease [Egibacteraceae bacterium]